MAVPTGTAVLSGMNFTVEIPGIVDANSPDAGLLEVNFPEARLDTLEYRNGNDKTNDVQKMQTVTKYGNLLLKRGVTGSLTWYNWWDAVRNGVESAATTVVVSLLSEDHSTPVLRWTFMEARPVKYQVSPLNALGEAVLTESLEVAFDRMEMSGTT